MTSLRAALEHATPERIADTLIDATLLDPVDDGRAADVIRPLIHDIYAALMPTPDQVEAAARHARGRDRLRQAVLAEPKGGDPTLLTPGPLTRRELSGATSAVLVAIAATWIVVAAIINGSTPSSGPQPTASQPGASVPSGSVGGPTLAPAGASTASLSPSPTRSPTAVVPSLPSTDMQP